MQVANNPQHIRATDCQPLTATKVRQDHGLARGWIVAFTRN